MRLAIPQAITIGISTATALVVACRPLVKIDVQCDKLCLASPGPTLPGLSFFDAGTAVGPGAPVDAPSSPSALDSAVLDTPTVEVDAEERPALDAEERPALDAEERPALDAEERPALDAEERPALDAEERPALDAALPVSDATVAWLSILEFNQVLKHLPNGSADDETRVLLTALSLTSTEELDFIESGDISIGRHGGVDTGVPASAPRWDGGIPLDAQSGLLCAEVGTQLRVAHFERSEETHFGTTLPFVLLAPELNLLDCMKDAPTEFRVSLALRAGRGPAKPTPLVLTSCVRSESHLGFP